jgi:hypothetical protein
MTVYVARPTVIREIETSDRGMSGRVTFHLPRVLPDEANADWPVTLSGELTWACGRWLGPAAAETDRGEGRLNLRLDGVDWVPSGALATCDFAAGSEVDAWIQLAGTDPPPGQQLPWWQARVRLVEVADGERAGRVAFIDMPRVDPGEVPISAGWPDALTGEFTWSCG